MTHGDGVFESFYFPFCSETMTCQPVFILRFTFSRFTFFPYLCENEKNDGQTIRICLYGFDDSVALLVIEFDFMGALEYKSSVGHDAYVNLKSSDLGSRRVCLFDAFSRAA